MVMEYEEYIRYRNERYERSKDVSENKCIIVFMRYLIMLFYLGEPYS